MERELCLVLDKLGKYRLVLKSGSSAEIDEYTSENFEDSEEIREKYQKEIDEFLAKHKEAIEKSNQPNSKGRIVVVIPENVGMDMNLYQRQVLYKKHIVAFKKIIEDKKIMIKFVDYERFRRGKEKLVSDFFCTMIRRPWNTTVTRNIKRWAKEEKEKKENYYEIVRDMLKVYHQEMQNNDKLPTIEKIYATYLNEKKEKAEKRVQSRGNVKVEKNKSHELVQGSVVIIGNIEEPEISNEESKEPRELEQNSTVVEENAIQEISDVVNDEPQVEQNSTIVEEIVEEPEVSNEEYYIIDGVAYTGEEVHKFIDLDDMMDYMTKGEVKKDSSYIPDGAKKK